MEKEPIILELIALRKKRGLSQRALAKKIGVGQYVIGRVETGKASPTLHTLTRIAEGLDTEIQITDKLGENRMEKILVAKQIPPPLKPLLEQLERSTTEEETRENQKQLAIGIAHYEKEQNMSDKCFSLLKAQFLNKDYLPAAQAKSKKMLFHGSRQIVMLPVRARCRAANDFGKCFYTTEHLELAKEWAGQYNKAGFVSSYEFRMDGLKVTNLNSEEYTILNWLGTLVRYRIPNNLDTAAEDARQYLVENFAVDLSKTDVIIGYRADDSYFQFAVDFLQNNIDLEVLGKAMRLGKLGEQVVIKSDKAFHRLMFQRSLNVAQKYHLAYTERDDKARNRYKKLKPKTYRQIPKDSITIMKIVQEEIKNDDPRLLRPLYRGRTPESWEYV